jgi:hypothetical protein
MVLRTPFPCWICYIKKNQKQRLRFFTKDQNNYTIRVTFDDNRTIYSQTHRPIKSGDAVLETVTDSTIVAETR